MNHATYTDPLLDDATCARPPCHGTEQSLLNILEASPVGVAILDAQQRIMFWNSRLIEITDGLQGEAFSEAASRNSFLAPGVYRRLLKRFVRDGFVRDIEIELNFPGQRHIWASVSIERIEFEGKPAALTWLYNITDRKLAELQLRASDEALLSVLEASPVGAAILDAAGHVLFWNSRLIDILGVQGEAFAEAAMLTFNGDTTLRDQLLSALETGEAVRDVEITKDTPNGTLHALVSLERVTFERQPGILMWIYDVSQIRAAIKSAEAATASKSAFLATMSHEIRTPMNGVLAMADLLSETRLTPDQASMVRTIRDSGWSLLTIINDILDFSKIEAGKLDIEQIAIQPREVAHGVYSLMNAKAQEKGLSLELTIDPAVPGWVTGDGVRLRQILINLIGNAIKFTEKGRVDIALRRRPEGGLSFAVTDTGIGLSDEQRQRLFRPFSQADDSTSRRFGGTGLGLSICMGLVHLMKGEIGCTSVLDQGSTFWFDLPWMPTDPPPEAQGRHGGARVPRFHGPTRAVAAAQGAAILVAEDNPTNRDVIGRILNRLGVVHDMVENGRSALGILLDPDEAPKYGLVLTDCHMPEMDGWALSEAIRRDETETGARRRPIIALTADVVKGTAERCAAAGMDGYLMKPVKLEDLNAAIEQYLPGADLLREPIEEDASSRQSLLVDLTGVVDLEALSEIAGADPAEMASMLKNFVMSAEDLLAELAAGLAEESEIPHEDTHRAAHSLKSAARYIGAGTLAEIAARLEKLLKSWDVAAARAGLPDLLAAFGAVRNAIEMVTLESDLAGAHTELASLAMAPEGASDNDLRSVVSLTEEAATKIIEAAEAISEVIESVGNPADVRNIQQQLTAIFEACSFPDLTSQHMRKVIARLTSIEERLDRVVGRLDIKAPNSGQTTSTTADQLDIDAMFS